jgi:hypothetical protein
VAGTFHTDTSFEGFIAVSVKILVFWVVTPCNFVGRYQIPARKSRCRAWLIREMTGVEIHHNMNKHR